MFKYLYDEKSGSLLGKGEGLIAGEGQEALDVKDIISKVRENPERYPELHVWGPSVEGKAEMLAPVPEEFMTAKEKAKIKKYLNKA